MTPRQLLSLPFWAAVFLYAASECEGYSLSEFVIFKIAVVAIGITGYLILNHPPHRGRQQPD